MNTITLKLISKTLASLISIILQNNLDLAQLKQNVYLDKLNLAAVLGVLLKRGLVSGSDVDEILVEIKRDSEVQEELYAELRNLDETFNEFCDDIKEMYETLSEFIKAFGYLNAKEYYYYLQTKSYELRFNSSFIVNIIKK